MANPKPRLKDNIWHFHWADPFVSSLRAEGWHRSLERSGHEPEVCDNLNRCRMVDFVRLDWPWSSIDRDGALRSKRH